MLTDPIRLSPLIRAAALVLTLSAAAACSGSGSPTSSSPPSPVPARNATTAPLLPTDAQALPDATPDSLTQLLSQLKGTPVVVNFWGSWCGPCREEAPALAAAAKRYGQVQFLGVDGLDTKDAARRYMSTYSMDYPSLFDPSPSGAIRVSYGFAGSPDTVVYDASGAKVATWEGAITAARLNSMIEEALASGSSPSPGSPASPANSPS